MSRQQLFRRDIPGRIPESLQSFETDFNIITTRGVVLFIKSGQNLNLSQKVGFNKFLLFNLISSFVLFYTN